MYRLKWPPQRNDSSSDGLISVPECQDIVLMPWRVQVIHPAITSSYSRFHFLHSLAVQKMNSTFCWSIMVPHGRSGM